MNDASSPAVRGVLLTHGAMAAGMVDAVRKIAGVGGDALVAVSNEGRSPDALCAELERILGDAPGIVFTDLQTGSCALTARLTCRNHGTRAVVFGVNLAMLLDFIFHRDLPLEELVPRVLERGRRSVQSQPETHADSPVPG